jgi:Uri superfamily endonuclease
MRPKERLSDCSTSPAKLRLPITSPPGTYALILACHKTGPVRIGKLGTMQLQPGFYVYVGSAFGTGGLQARLRHHLHIAPQPHWHIDYLRAVCNLVEVWYTTDAARLEHRWAKTMAGLKGSAVPMPGFGSSDCDCMAHLFRLASPPSFKAFQRCAGQVEQEKLHTPLKVRTL